MSALVDVAIVVAIFCPSLIARGAGAVKRMLDPHARERDVIAEKRRVLERQRDGWEAALRGKSRKAATAAILDIDKQLLELAEDEASLG